MPEEFRMGLKPWTVLHQLRYQVNWGRVVMWIDDKPTDDGCIYVCDVNTPCIWTAGLSKFSVSLIHYWGVEETMTAAATKMYH